jgi:hypothetical protein
LPFARELFEAADRMRGSVESAEYKHLVLGLLFLKYISDSFERRRRERDIMPSCSWGGDSCAIFGVDQPRDMSLVRRADPLIEVRSRALDNSVKVWWVPPSAIQGVWLGSERRSLSPERDAGSLVWSHEPDGCGCELTEIVREQQQLWLQRWA